MLHSGTIIIHFLGFKSSVFKFISGHIQNMDPRSMDPVHHPCAPSPWTTPVDHPLFCKVTTRKKIFRRKREVILALVCGQFKQEPMTNYINLFLHVMVMVMNLYSAFSINMFKCTLQASDLWVRSDISIYRSRWQPLSVH